MQKKNQQYYSTNKSRGFNYIKVGTFRYLFTKTLSCRMVNIAHHPRY